MRHINIPIFIPHLGCPNDCVFCNQKKISGKTSFDINSVENEIITALSTIDTASCEVEIAYFGGSFTGIERSDMLHLLEVAHRFIESGDVRSIRVSTRPDYINDEILSILKRYGVCTVELGIQSFSEEVLAASKRGHTAADSEHACRAVLDYGFSLVGQMMTGLPKSTVRDEVLTAQKICALGAHAARIYSTVVFYETELMQMMQRGEYTPLEMEDAVSRAADVLDVFVRNGLPVIRLGLCAADNLFARDGMYAGAYHSAFGELVKSRLYLDRIRCALRDIAPVCGSRLIIYTPRGATSAVVGQKRANTTVLQNEYNVKTVKVIEIDEIPEYNIRIVKTC